jgi:hypothetical protein
MWKKREGGGKGMRAGATALASSVRATGQAHTPRMDRER